MALSAEHLSRLEEVRDLRADLDTLTAAVESIRGLNNKYDPVFTYKIETAVAAIDEAIKEAREHLLNEETQIARLLSRKDTPTQ